jgi:hypothetical protein
MLLKTVCLKKILEEYVTNLLNLYIIENKLNCFKIVFVSTQKSVVYGVFLTCRP